MDALLTALLGCLLGGIGDKSQLLALMLSARFRSDGAVIAGAALAVAANATLAAFAGALIGPMLGSQARLLFLALALLMLGGGMLWPVKQPDPLADWPTGPFLTSALGLFILGFGDGPQFLILGIAARTADPVLAGLGGALGMMAALIPAILLRDQLTRAIPLRAIRIGGAAIFLASGLGAAVSALGLTD
ncbi:TMEM165/GDT1 family protein [Sphingobium sp. DC-2]|uniref:TMEM165/GDT1 family protein n=1 Tax=Sphingobium sp. DC-2 TaxID=1303256 RepID=UPI0004C3ACC4|nr:TMEM165/GDT1 family protein [Sphingobium sp. DC-2]